jgi:hypothetical protein
MCCWRRSGFPNAAVVCEGKQAVLSGYCADQKLLMCVYWHPLRVCHSPCLIELGRVAMVSFVGATGVRGVRSDKFSIYRFISWGFNAIGLNSKNKK